MLTPVPIASIINPTISAGIEFTILITTADFLSNAYKAIPASPS